MKFLVLVLSIAIAILAAFGGTVSIGMIYLIIIGEPNNTSLFNSYFNYLFAGLFVIIILVLRLTLADRYKFAMEHDD